MPFDLFIFPKFNENINESMHFSFNNELCKFVLIYSHNTYFCHEHMKITNGDLNNENRKPIR